MEYSRFFPPFNHRRYSRPWGALVSFPTPRPEYQFIGHWDGQAVLIDAQPGDVLAFGQRDYRGGNSVRRFYLAQPDGGLREVTEPEARGHWRERQSPLAA